MGGHKELASVVKGHAGNVFAGVKLHLHQASSRGAIENADSLLWLIGLDQPDSQEPAIPRELRYIVQWVRGGKRGAGPIEDCAFSQVPDQDIAREIDGRQRTAIGADRAP